MAFQIAGKLHKVFDTEQKTETFQAREFVIETTESQYPQMIKFQLTQDKCALVDNYQAGDQINVHFDLRGREWNDKYFTNLNAWRIENADAQGGSSGGGASSNAGGQSGSAYQAGSTQSGNAASSSTSKQPDFDDDIPF